MEALDDFRASIQLAIAKPIKDGRLLVKIRPQLDARVEWTEAFAILDASEGCDSKDVAPLGNIVREFKNKSP